MGPRARAPKEPQIGDPFGARARADPFTPRTSFKGRCVRNRAQKRKSRAWLKEHLLRFEIIVHQIHQLRQSKHDKPIPTIPKWWSWSRSHLLHFNFSWRSPLKRSIVRASCLQVEQLRTYVWSSGASSPEFSSAAREKASAMLKSCWKSRWCAIQAVLIGLRLQGIFKNNQNPHALKIKIVNCVFQISNGPWCGPYPSN